MSEFRILSVAGLLIFVLTKIAVAENLIIRIGGKELEVTAARTIDELSTGLSNLPGLPSNGGMLFILPYTGRHCFTTDQMLFPIDIVFMDESMTVTEVTRGEPGTISPYCHPDTRFVVETGIGLKISRGEKMEVQK